MRNKPENNHPPLPPAIMVHGLAQAKYACAQGMPVTLLSAPGAAGAWGCLWWQRLLVEAGHTGPALLDCGAAPGRAVEALTLGLRGIVLSACPVWDEIADMAARRDALLLPTPPAALDLGQKRNERRLLVWLAG